MKIDFAGLEAFQHIAELGSFHAAASRLNLSGTAVSHRVKRLEDNLGVRLFNRTSRRVYLTQAGSELLPVSKLLLAELAIKLDVIAERYRQEQSVLRLACMPTISANFLGPVFAEFKQKHPAVSIQITDASASKVAEAVAGGLSEFGLATMAANDMALSYEPVVNERYSLICPRDHQFAGRESVAWSELENTPLVRLAPSTAYRRIIDAALGPRAERLNWSAEVQHTTTALMLVQGGVGLAVVPDPPPYHLDHFGVRCLSLVRPRAAHTISFVTRFSANLSPMASDFKRYLFAYVSAAATGHRSAVSHSMS